jgi:hypothetical protein
LGVLEGKAAIDAGGIPRRSPEMRPIKVLLPERFTMTAYSFGAASGRHDLPTAAVSPFTLIRRYHKTILFYYYGMTAHFVNAFVSNVRNYF